MKKNDIDVEGDVNSCGDINIGNTIETQNNLIINNDPHQLIEYVKKDVELTLAKQQLVAEQRARSILEKYSEKVLPKLIKSEMIDAFSDPAIQVFFRSEQKAAICSSRENDLNILSEMLIYRIKNKNSIEKKASVSKAIDVVDKISDDALIALTIHYFLYFYPTSGDILKGLKKLDEILGKLLENFNLPENNEWIDNVDILGLARISSFTSTERLEDLYFERLDGYCLNGIQQDTSEYNDVVKKLTENNIPTNILQNHILNPNHVRLAVTNESSIDDLYLVSIQQSNQEQQEIRTEFSNEQKKILKSIYLDSKRNKDCEHIIRENFVLKINEFENLKKVMEWWNNNLAPSVEMNSVGRVIAHTNIKGIVEDCPDMV